MTSAYICPRSRNTGRSTRNPRKTTSPKTASATKVRRVTRGLSRSITTKASVAVKQAPGQLDEAGPHQVPEALHVVHDPGHEVARLVRVVERDRQAAHVLLDPDPHLGDQLLRRLRDELDEREGAEALHDGGGHDGPDQGQEQGGLAAADDVVDQVLGGGGQDEPRHPAHGHEQEGQGQQAPPGLHERPDVGQQCPQPLGLPAPGRLPGQPRHDPGGSPHRGILPRRTRGTGFHRGLHGPRTREATDERPGRPALTRGSGLREFSSDAPPWVPYAARPHGPLGASR